MSRAMGRNREDLEAGCAELLPERRTLACSVASIAIVMFVVLNWHRVSNLPVCFVLGIVCMAAYILMYANCQLRPRGAEDDSTEVGNAEDRRPVRRTRSNLPALRVRLALMDREFVELDYDDLRALDADFTPGAPSTSEGDTGSRYMVQSHVHTRRMQGNELTCIVCLEQFNVGELIRSFPCLHQFHADCVDPWVRQQGTCPICKYRVGPGLTGSDNDEAESISMLYTYTSLHHVDPMSAFF